VIALKSRVVTEDGRGIVRELYSMDPNGHVELSFSSRYMGQWCRIDLGEVERGWARQYSRDNRKLVYELPRNWEEMKPMQRYAYWLNMLGGRYGFPIGAMQEGSTFYAYFIRQKGRNSDKYYSDIKKVYRDHNDVWHDACPTELGTVDVHLLRALSTLIEEAYAASESFNFGANARQPNQPGQGNQGSLGFDEEAGF